MATWCGGLERIVACRPSGLKKIMLASGSKTQGVVPYLKDITEGIGGGDDVWRRTKRWKEVKFYKLFSHSPPCLTFTYSPFSCTLSQLSVFGVTKAKLNRPYTAIRVDLGSFLY